jgi:hypothetical protein
MEEGRSTFKRFLHSLDHKLVVWNLEDPLWLDINDPRFGAMAELGCIVRVRFVPEVIGYYFNRYFQGSGYPFMRLYMSKLQRSTRKWLIVWKLVFVEDTICSCGCYSYFFVSMVNLFCSSFLRNNYKFLILEQFSYKDNSSQ